MAIMKGDNQNVLFFENKSMRSLYDDLNRWRNETGREFSSVNIEKDGDKFCCIAFANPVDVVIVDGGGKTKRASVNRGVLFAGL